METLKYYDPILDHIEIIKNKYLLIYILYLNVKLI